MKLQFWEKVHPPQYVICHMSHVTCLMSCVTRQQEVRSGNFERMFIPDNMSQDTWHVTCYTWHVTCDMWHVVRDEHSLKISAPYLLMFRIYDISKICHMSCVIYHIWHIFDRVVCCQLGLIRQVFLFFILQSVRLCFFHIPSIPGQ